MGNSSSNINNRNNNRNNNSRHINNNNIHTLVRQYIENRNNLPVLLRDIPIGDWDVSRVTDMSRLFANFNTFNEPLTNWDVSNVTTMNYMFEECNSFNQDLSTWNVSNVRDMGYMFKKCSIFDETLSNWDVSNVRDMGGMFRECTNFNQPLDNWNVSHVTDMQSMFVRCTNFNKPLGNWNVSHVTDMGLMFYKCTNFNKPLGNWNVSHVTDMGGMFRECSNFNQNLSNWNMSRVRNISNMFDGCIRLTVNPISQFNQTRIQDYETIFLNTPLHAQQLQPLPQRHQGLAYEVHNAFADLDLQKFMTIIRRENNGESNYKNTNNILEPVISYINSQDTALSSEQKTRYISNIRGTIRKNVNAYIADHPELKDDTLEVIQFVLSQDPKYKDLYIETFENECIGGYTTGTKKSCTKGMFERVYMGNKGTIEGICFEELQGATSDASRDTACKPVYLELYSTFTPGAHININDIFYKWYNQFSYDAVPEEENTLKNFSIEERKQHFRDFVKQDEAISQPIWNNREFQNKLEQSIQKNSIIFETLSSDAGLGKRKRKRRRNTEKKKKKQRKTMKKQRKTLKKQRKTTMKRLKENIMKGKNKIIRKTRGQY